jgi:SAM-dependent methyltransferase
MDIPQREYWRHPKSDPEVNPNQDIGFQELVDLTEEPVLDFGCGFGRMAKHFRDESYIGCDIAMHRVCACLKEFPRKEFYHIHSHESLQVLGLGFFNTVLANNVLHHVADEEILPMLKTFRFISVSLVVGTHVTEGNRFTRDGRLTNNNRSMQDYHQLLWEAGFYVERELRIYNPHYGCNFHVFRAI